MNVGVKDDQPEVIDIVVVRREERHRRAVGRIAAWYYWAADPVCRGLIGAVREGGDLDWGIRSIGFSAGKRVLVTVGFEESAVVFRLRRYGGGRPEVIIVPPEQVKAPMEASSCWVGDHDSVVVVGDVIPALRKAILRLRTRRHVQIRPLDTDEDFASYFALRYRVLKEQGYVAATDCVESGWEVDWWEVDWADRRALALGAFAEGALVGGVRVVRDVGEDEGEPVFRVVRLLRERKDPQLEARFGGVEGMRHPFCAGASFGGCEEYYDRLIKQGAAAAEVGRVIVAPAWRCRGIGEVLVDSSVCLARSKGIDVVFIACPANQRALYARCGFRMVEGVSCERFAGADVRGILMERWLGKE